MIPIGLTDIYLPDVTVPRVELESYTKALFEDWVEFVDATLALEDYAIALTVEDGSVKALGKFGVGLYALYIGIGQYGSFISGVQTLRAQLTQAGTYLSQRASIPFGADSQNMVIQRRGEALSSLEGIFRKVKAGHLSVEEAMLKAQEIFGETEVTEFYDRLEVALSDEQVAKGFDQLELDQEVLGEKDRVREDVQGPDRQSPPKTPPIPVDHFRVEMWRDSRQGRLNVRVMKK